MKAPRWLTWLGAVVFIVFAWIGFDLSHSERHDAREFDAHEVARLETAMWRSYYDRQPVRLFAELTQLLRSQYGFPFSRSVLGAFYAARAAEVFQAGHARPDYLRAMPDLVSYYRLVRKTEMQSFDVNKAAALELEWWIRHRERSKYDRNSLRASLADLQAEIYGRAAGEFEEHAGARADAMLLRDRLAETGSLSADDWMRIRELLDMSWVTLGKAVTAPQRTEPGVT